MSEPDSHPQPEATPAPGAAPPPAFKLRLKRILVPVDFSECSDKAVDYAVAFAQQSGASLVLVHVMELQYAGSGLGEVETPLFEKELRENASSQLQRLLDQRVAGAVPCETVVAVGKAWQEIGLTAQVQDADLIVMGTHGYTGFKHVVMGSTAERVVRHAPCPVLVVREREREFLQGGQPAAAGAAK
jgi:nucleotide-binding universal stress UspA family protein